MEMHQIRYFLAVCETLNFTRAAKMCGVAQPSLTRAIKKLEAELGGQLFRRERNFTHLSDLGEAMRPLLEQSLATADAAKAEAQSFTKRRSAPLKLGIMCTIGPSRVIPLIRTLEGRSPGLAFKPRERSGRELIEELLNGEIDIALVGLPAYPEKINAEPLFRERYVVAFPPGHRFERMASVPVAEMAGEDYLSRLNCEYPEYWSDLVGEWTCPLNIRYESEREDWIQAMILAGMGCAFMPEYLPLFPGIKTRSVVEPEIFREISLATVRGRRFTPAVESFARLARANDWNARG